MQVSQEQALEIAQEKCDLEKVENSELKHLSKEELSQIPKKDKDITPVYYVFTGANKQGESIKVFVSSNVSSHYLRVKN